MLFTAPHTIGQHARKSIDSHMGNLIRVILTVIIPPVGVFFKVGFGLHFWVNILLTFLGYIPGLIHAIWVLSSEK